MIEPMTVLQREITIVPAREASLAAVNALVARSKAYWNYPQDYLSRAIPLLQITPLYLSANFCFEVVTSSNELVAFFSLSESHPRVVIDNLWVEPLHIRQGIGTAVVRFILEFARARGWQRLWVLPDPPAEYFYQALGFADTRERIASRVPGGPVFSVYCIKIPNDAPSAR
jgi:GNAT superfamily N-acetyltransferase